MAQLSAGLAAKPIRYWAWVGAAGITAVTWLILLALLLMTGASRQDAMDAGQRLEFHLTDGTILGKKISLALEERRPALPETLPTETPPASGETPAPAPSPAPAAETTPAEPTPTTMPAARIPPRENPEITESELAAPPPVIAAIRSKLSAGERTKEALPGPDPKLLERTPEGDLPVIAKDGTRPADYYARPFDHEGSMPVIAVAITGLGYNKALTESATNLPGTFSLAYSSYAPSVDIWVKSARQFGHEIWIELPMEPPDYPASDPGPHAIFAEMQPHVVVRNLYTILARIQGAVGIITPKDEVATSNVSAFSTMLDELAKRGLLAAVTNTNTTSERDDVLKIRKTFTFVADVVIDESMNATMLRAALEKAETLAKQQGHVLLTVKATPGALQALAAWESTLEGKGIQLAPASALADLNS